jgi:hypothetical protein
LGSESETIAFLRRELRQLRKSLTEEHLWSIAYDKMIDIAEEMFHIEIPKKLILKLIAEYEGKLSSLCRMFGVNRQSHYQRENTYYERMCMRNFVLEYIIGL